MAEVLKGKGFECDVAVIGGGILGLAVAAVCANQGYHVCLFRMRDHGRPRADTLRNQGWLQSGLMYVGHYGEKADPKRKIGRALATRMRIGGLAMLQELGLPLPNEHEFGIFRVADEASLNKLLNDADALHLPNVRRMEALEARGLLGKVYTEDSIYCTVPDLPFPEADVVHALRAWAIREKAELIQVDAPLRLAPNNHSESGVVLQWGGNQMASRVTVAAAGAGNCELLKGLGLNPMMEFQQTPLLVVHDTLEIKAPIFNDRVQGYSFVRHPGHQATIPKGALIVATRCQRMVPFASPEARRIEQDDIEEFKKWLPRVLEPHALTGRFTAGFEVIPKTDPERPYVAPWIQWCPDYPRLVHAMPGRATLGLAVAKDVLSQISAKIGLPKSSRSCPVDAVQWEDDIHMHFHGQYDFNDWECPRGGC